MGRFLRRGILILLPLLLAACWSLTWQEFLAPDSRFHVLMPGLPEMQVNQVPTGFGVLEQTVFMVDRGPQAYMVGYTTLDEAILGEYSPDAILEDFAGRGTAGVGGEVLDYSVTEVDGYPGRAVRLSVADGDGVIDARFVLAGDRVYQVAAIVATKIVDEEVNARFLDSFKVLK